MTVDLVLKDAKVFTPNGIFEAGLAIDGDRIVKVAREANLPPASERMSLDGNLLLPGLVDIHVHLRGQGLSYKEDFYTGTAAAAAGGVTTVADMPNNMPVTMSVETVKERMKAAEGDVVVNVAFYSAFPEKIEEAASIILEGGAVAFKLFMSKKVGGVDPKDSQLLSKAFKEAASLQVPVAVHAEDPNLLEERRAEALRSGKSDVEAYLEVHSPSVEEAAIERAVKLAEEAEARIHICHLSSSRGVRAVSAAKRRGLPVSCEVTPHHLLLTVEDLKSIGAAALVNPPLRSRRDVDSLWRALQAGFIDVFASDHAPHRLEEKSLPIWEAETGIPGLETMLPLLLTQVDRGLLTLGTLVRMASERPAEVLGLEGRGRIVEGGYADLVVVDLSERFRIEPSTFHSKAKYSPFRGWVVKGKPVKTFVNGRLVMDGGEIVAEPGDGRVLRRRRET